ncbi:unnamed protein product [Polarella glacialis]|uniref:Uncharacterized protein n=1 Tax=Polarella glacialis TaxID=89957 RepID=A0A813IGB6_POLGL|nr:unnamed protein product [Polarella glacialis]
MVVVVVVVVYGGGGGGSLLVGVADDRLFLSSLFTCFNVSAKQSFCYKFIKIKTTVISNCLFVVVSISIPLFGQSPALASCSLCVCRFVFVSGFCVQRLSGVVFAYLFCVCFYLVACFFLLYCLWFIFIYLLVIDLFCFDCFGCFNVFCLFCQVCDPALYYRF